MTRRAPICRAAHLAIVATLVVLCAPVSASAHDAGITSVVRIFIDQSGDRRYTLSTMDTGVPAFGEGVLPSHCQRLENTQAVAGARSRIVFECQRPLTFDDVIVLPWSLGVVVVATWADGSAASAYFLPEGRSVPIRLAEVRAAPGSRFRLAQRYFALGMEHILLGIDHLLFVLGLLLLVKSVGPLVKTVTAFTVAHSLTLAAAVLGIVPVERAPVEAAIALSIVLVAREIVVARRGSVHLVHRSPWLVAFVFGLLHGLGFAGALGEIGLRSRDIPVALLFFNIGVEAGQLAFVVGVLAVNRLIRRVRPAVTPWVEPALGYSLGAVATLWFFNRLPAIWGT